MKNSIDILSFDAVSDSEQGFTLEMKNADGSSTGISLIILGKHANAVQSWTKKIFSKMQRDEQLAKRRGKEVELPDIDELRDQNIEGAAIRVTGWLNVTQPFDKSLLKQVLTKNPHWVDAILEASGDDANFMKPNL